MSVVMLMGRMTMLVFMLVVMVMMAMLMFVLMPVSRRSMQKFHIVVVIFELRIQQHIKIAAIHSRFAYAADLIAEPGGRNTVQRFAQSLLVRA